MRPTRPPVSAWLLAGALLLPAARPAAAQLDTTNFPARPAARLARLERFFGTYVYTDNEYGGLGPWRGTVAVRPAIKGWYVHLVIDTRFGPIDRQLEVLITWDEALGRYRTWSFDTNPPGPPGRIEGEGRFEGDEFVIELKNVPGPHGEPPATLRDRVRMESPDELVIVTEVDPPDAEPFRIGTWRSMRISAR